MTIDIEKLLAGASRDSGVITNTAPWLIPEAKKDKKMIHCISKGHEKTDAAYHIRFAGDFYGPYCGLCIEDFHRLMAHKGGSMIMIPVDHFPLTNGMVEVTKWVEEAEGKHG